MMLPDPKLVVFFVVMWAVLICCRRWLDKKRKCRTPKNGRITKE